MTTQHDVFEMVWPITGPASQTRPAPNETTGLRALALRGFVAALHAEGLAAQTHPTTDVVPTSTCHRATGHEDFRRSPFTLRMRAPVKPRPQSP